MLITQILTIHYNGHHNAYGGERDKFKLTTVEDESKIREEIQSQLVNQNSYVLVKYKDKMYMCEWLSDNGKYSRKQIDYHPYFNKFLDK
jgi:hypothetical protein